MIEPIQQHPQTVSPDSSLSLTCTVNGVSDFCDGNMINNPKKILEWHTPYLPLRIDSMGTNNHALISDSLFDNFNPQDLTFIPNCFNGSLTSTLTFVATSEFKNTPFQCARVIDHIKVWSQAILLNGEDLSTYIVWCIVHGVCLIYYQIWF